MSCSLCLRKSGQAHSQRQQASSSRPLSKQDLEGQNSDGEKRSGKDDNGSDGEAAGSLPHGGQWWVRIGAPTQREAGNTADAHSQERAAAAGHACIFAPADNFLLHDNSLVTQKSADHGMTLGDMH
jgi:hypothetical protein